MPSLADTRAVFTAVPRHGEPDAAAAALPAVTVERARARRLLGRQADIPGSAVDPVRIATSIDPEELLTALRASPSGHHTDIINLTRLVLVSDARGLLLRCE